MTTEIGPGPFNFVVSLKGSNLCKYWNCIKKKLFEYIRKNYLLV